MIEKLLTLLNGSITLLSRKIEALGAKSDKTEASILALKDEIKNQKAPVVNFQPPVVNVSVPDVVVPELKIPDIVIPEIKIPNIVVPEPKVTVNVPEIKIPEFKIPTPQVKVDCQPPVVNVNTPETIEVTGFKSFVEAITATLQAKYSILSEVNRHNPVPVIMVDKDGVYQKLTQTIVGAMGGSVLTQDDRNTLQSIAGLNIPAFDTINATYPTGTTEVYTYLSGGATVGAITVTYTTSAKDIIQSVTKL